MSRRLVMMRHAKSSWAFPELEDHARPLNKRGRRSSVAVGRGLDGRGWRPDLVILSDSKRTRETLERIEWGSAVEQRLEPTLYHGGIEQVRAALRGLTDPRTVLLLGHEPGWSEAIAWLSGRTVELKTADAVLLEAATADPARGEAPEDPEWGDLVAAPGRFAWVDHVRSRIELEGSLSTPGSDVVP